MFYYHYCQKSQLGFLGDRLSEGTQRALRLLTVKEVEPFASLLFLRLECIHGVFPRDFLCFIHGVGEGGCEPAFHQTLTMREQLVEVNDIIDEPELSKW